MTTTKGLRRRRQRRKYGDVNDKVRREATTVTKDKNLFGGRDGEKRKGKNPKRAKATTTTADWLGRFGALADSPY